MSRHATRSTPATLLPFALALLITPHAAGQADAPTGYVLFHPTFPSADGYGQAVATDATVLAATDRAHVSILARTGAPPTWAEQAVLPLWSDWPPGSFQPRALAVDGETVYVGETNAPGFPAGAVRVLHRSGSAWSDVAVLTPPGSPPGEAFGVSADVDGAWLAVGAPGSGGTGAVHLFERSGGAWTWRARLTAQDAAPGDDFGAAVALSGGVLVVGAPLADVDGLPNAGAAYVFEVAGSAWIEAARLVEDAPGHGEGHFGWSVAADGDTVLVGSPNSDTQAVAWVGAGFVWHRSQGAWSSQGRLAGVLPQVASGDAAGWSVALEGDRALLGAPFSGWTADGQLAFVGNLLLFERSGSDWTFGGVMGLAHPYGFEVLGWDAALAGDTTVAGVPAWGLDGGAVYEVSVGLTLPTWLDLGYGLPGAAGVPRLQGEGALTAGSPGALDLGEAAPDAAAWILVATHEAPSPFKGGTLVPVPPLLGALIATDGAGAAHLRWSAFPPGVPTGTAWTVQVVVQDARAPGGYALSNTLAVTTP